MFQVVAGEHLRTTFADAPTVLIGGVNGGSVCSMRYGSSPREANGTIWTTTLRFTRVLDVRFYDFELGLEPPNPEAYEFTLIELIQSEILTAFTSSRALERTASPMLGIADLHHYRIGFDDHGSYDIVCTGLDISSEQTRPP